MSSAITDFQAILNAIVAIIVSVAGAAFLYLSRRKIKEQYTGKNEWKTHTEVLKDMPILHYIDRDMQSAQTELKQLHHDVDLLRNQVTKLEGELNVLRAEIKQLKQ